MGTASWHALKKMIKESLAGSDFISCREHCSASSYDYHNPLHFHRYKNVDTKSAKDNAPDSHS